VSKTKKEVTAAEEEHLKVIIKDGDFSDYMDTLKGKEVLVRSNNQGGAHVGILIAYESSAAGVNVMLDKCRCLWSWSGAYSSHEIAADGVAVNSKISTPVRSFLANVCEIIPVAAKASATLASRWK